MLNNQLFEAMLNTWVKVIQDIWLCPVYQLSGVIVNIGNDRNSNDPEVEQTIITNVATYGRQLGRTIELLEVLLHHLDSQLADLGPKEKEIRDDFSRMAAEIAKIKMRSGLSKDLERLHTDLHATLEPLRITK